MWQTKIDKDEFLVPDEIKDPNKIVFGKFQSSEI
jgi:hypothetical protein